MKKQLLFAVVALSAVLLAGCKDPNNPDDPTGKASLKITPNQLVLVLGDNPVSLSATITPADAAATIKWSSSNPSVATVTNKGFVQAQDYGDCYIYATAGDLKDSCFCHVQTFMESVIFTGAIELDEDTMYMVDGEGKPIVYDIQSSSGESYRAYLSLATMYVFSDGFYVNNAGQFDGAQEGVIMEMEAPMFYATAYLNNTDRGTIFCLGEWEVTDTASTTTVKKGFPGSIDEAAYMTQMKSCIADINETGGENFVNFAKAAAKAIKNPTLKTYTYDTDESGQGGYYSSYIPEAICRSAKMSLNGNYPSSSYMCGLDYSEVVYQQFAQDTVLGSYYDWYWGLNLGYNEETDVIFFNDEKVHFNPETKAVYGNVPSAEVAPKKAPRLVSVPVVSENKELAAKVRAQIENCKNAKVIRKH